jgi:hypothetical protein
MKVEPFTRNKKTGEIEKLPEIELSSTTVGSKIEIDNNLYLIKETFHEYDRYAQYVGSSIEVEKIEQ